MKVCLFPLHSDGKDFKIFDMSGPEAEEALKAAGVDHSALDMEATKAREQLVESLGEIDEEVILPGRACAAFLHTFCAPSSQRISISTTPTI